MNISNTRKTTINTNIFLILHFFIGSIGFLGLIRHISEILGQSFFAPLNVFIAYSDWAVLSGNPSKPIELVQYALSVLGLAIYYLSSLYFIRKLSDQAQGFVNKWCTVYWLWGGYLGLLFLFNAWLLKNHGDFTGLFLCIWFAVLAIPTLPLLSILLEWVTKKSRILELTLFGFMISSLVYAFYPYISGGVEVGNDYMDIPSQTILSTGVVDNTDYINKHRIGGLRKHDPRVLQDLSETPREGEFIKLKKTETLSSFLQSNKQKFSYDDKGGVLLVKDLLTSVEAENIAKIASDEAERGQVYSFYYNQLTKSQTKRTYSVEEIEFIRKNKLEFHDQALAGHYFHHQHTMLGTINEYTLGKPRNETTFLYGWLGTVVIAELMKIAGGVSFTSYQQVSYSFYPLYYVLLVGAAAIIFRKIRYVLLVGLVSIGSFYLIGFETIRYAPGFNPIRHFFDIFALVCFYLYLFKPKKTILYLSLAMAFSVLGIIISKEFGLVLLLSMLAAIIFRLIVEQKKFAAEALVMIVATISAIASLVLIVTAKNPTLFYVLMGVAAPPIHWIKMYSLLFVFSLIYVLLLVNRKVSNNWFYLTLFWFMYTQGLLIYYIWNPVPNHLFSLGAIYGMLIALLVKCWSTNYVWVQKNEEKLLTVIVLAASIFIFLPSVTLYYLDQRAYEKSISDHKIHQWNFPRANFVSTMDPGVFYNSVELVKKYSSEPAIFILSKYDNILPFLADKYSAMPYAEMALSLVTEKEMNHSVAFLKDKHPEYFFVDSDILRSYSGDIFDMNDPVTAYIASVYDASRGRAMVLNNFGKIFKDVEYLYTPVEIGQLITVYKLRPSLLKQEK